MRTCCELHNIYIKYGKCAEDNVDEYEQYDCSSDDANSADEGDVEGKVKRDLLMRTLT